MKKEVDFSVHVKEVMNRNNVQLQSFALLDKDVKNSFFQHRKKAVLLIRNKVYEREISSLDDKTIDVFDTMLIPYLKNGQLVLLVLPTDGKLRYVLQTSVAGLYVDRIRLKILDPRKNRRFSLSGSRSVRIRTIDDATALRIQGGELRSVRQVAGILPDNFSGSKELEEQGEQNRAGTPEKSESPGETKEQKQDVGAMRPDPAIQDMLFCAEKDESAEDYTAILQQEGVSGTIADISLGGMCISLPENKEAFFTDQLVVLEYSLANQKDDQDAKPLALLVFAVVRNHATSEGLCRMSLEFLSLLPKAVEGYFLEKEPDPPE